MSDRSLRQRPPGAKCGRPATGLTALVLAFALFDLAGAAPVPAADPGLAPAIARIVAESNAFRLAQGRAPTRPVAALEVAAREFAQFMARNDLYGHSADGREPAERAAAQGYALCALSENIAFQFDSRGFGAEDLARRFVQGWIDSPGHRRNLLAPEVSETGVAVARSARTGRYYAVQMFGQPAAARWRFEIDNRSQRAVEYRIGEKSFALPPRSSQTHEQCAAVSLRIVLPGQAQPLTLQPAKGTRYRVEAVAEGLRVSSD